jgi:hypothetical protein
MANPVCRSARRHFSDLLDEQPLTWSEAAWGRFHATLCPMCRRTYRSLRATREAVAALRDPEPSRTVKTPE